MVIGYDGDKFVFWDPDSSVGSVSGKRFGHAFLSTAALPAENELYVEVREDGSHFPTGNKNFQKCIKHDYTIRFNKTIWKQRSKPTHCFLKPAIGFIRIVLPIITPFRNRFT